MTGESLLGKVAIVTGGGRGLGRAIAAAFAAEGADVAVIDRLEEDLDAVRIDIEAQGRKSFAVHADIGDVSRIPEIFEEVVAELGELDILMNNAGVQVDGPAVEITEEEWDLAMGVNAKALFFCAQAAGRRFLERGTRGKIINTCSTRSVTAAPDLAAYCASKGAVLQITRALAAEWAQHGINVNAVGPTMVYTEMTKARLDNREFRDAYIDRLPAGEFPRPEHIADAAVFLAGPRSEFIHGHMLLVDSGQTII